MFKIILGFTLMTLGLNAHAQTLKVVKVKGKQAIVNIQSGSLSEGETVNVGDGGGMDIESGGGGTSGKGNRNYVIGGSFIFSNTKADTAGAEAVNTLGLSAKFGWNFKRFEVGPILEFTSSKSGTTELTDTAFGGFAAYNFIENKSGVPMIFSVDGVLTMGSSKISTGSSSSTTNMTSATVGPFVKWFGLSNDFCLEAGAVYSYRKDSISTGDTTITGIKLVGGISTYF